MVLTSGEGPFIENVPTTSVETSISYPDKFYFNRVDDNGTFSYHYGFIEISLDNFVRINYNGNDEFYLVESYELDDDGVYHINGDDITFDVSNRTLSIDDRIFYINSTINSRY